MAESMTILNCAMEWRTKKVRALLVPPTRGHLRSQGGNGPQFQKLACWCFKLAPQPRLSGYPFW